MGSNCNHFKWSCLWSLGELLTKPYGQSLVKVVFCTAVPSIRQGEGKRSRHMKFNQAQEARGVTVINGHYVREPILVDGVDTGDVKWTEKQSDINVSLELIMDGLEDVYDVALLLSADTDQVATARVFNNYLTPKGKKFIGVAPPNRNAPMGYSNFDFKSISVSQDDIENCIMPSEIMFNKKMIRRPTEYDPPKGWIKPSEVKKIKPPKAPKKGAWSKPTKS